MTTTTIDAAQAEAFGGRLGDFINGSGAMLGVSLGHRTGLFDVMSELPPRTSQEIAEAADLDERYVREWLGVMLTSGIVEYDAAGGTYILPPEHAVSLTRAAGPGNLAIFGEAISLMAQVSDELEQAFQHGGGVPYSSFPTFHRLMAETSALRFDHNLIEEQVPLVRGIVSRLEAGIDVADLGCGAGHAINLMAQAWPSSRFVGFDFSPEAIDEARAEAERMGLSNARFEVQDVPLWVGDERFDLVTTFDAVHDQADPAGFLRVASTMLRPGGHYLCVDIGASSDVAKNVEHPMGPMMYAISLFHCMTVSLALGGAGLGTMWGEELAVEMLEDAGFSDIEIAKVDSDPFNNYYVCSKPA